MGPEASEPVSRRRKDEHQSKSNYDYVKEALPTHTSWGAVLSNSPDPDVSEVSHIQGPVRGDHQRGWTVEPCVFSVAVARLVAVAVSVILSRQGK